MWVYTDVHIPLIINAPAGILLHFRCVTPDVATIIPCRFVDHTKTLLQQSSRCSLPQPFHFSGHLTLKTGQESKREQERGFFFFFFFFLKECHSKDLYFKYHQKGGDSGKALLRICCVNLYKKPPEGWPSWKAPFGVIILNLNKKEKKMKKKKKKSKKKKKRVQGDFFKLLITKSYHLYDQMAQIFNVKLYKLVCWLTDWLRI